ncbi:MAG: SIS domain-containing protein [Rhodospirillaceae bacterium]|nr:SIS domain-containing protein [Rhodospirillaceae bacterium]
MANAFADYLRSFVEVLNSTEATDNSGKTISVDAGIARAHDAMRKLIGTPNKMMFVGNGGSAGIAGHMAIDFAKNGGVRSVTFNDASSLTCLGNDLGYDQVFAKQVEMQGLPGDILLAISSSGESKNILAAVDQANAMGCTCITLSGFAPGNRLRARGATNFYVASGVYGFVETAHQAILHAILDTAMGWTTEAAMTQPSRKMNPAR